MFSCPNCSDTFEAEDALQDHKHARHIGSINFDIAGTMHSVQPENEGGFKCPCSHHPTAVIYPDVATLVAHIKTIKNWENPRPPEPIRVISDQLIDTAILRHYSFVVNIAHILLICTSCSTVVHSQHVTSHLKKKHESSLPSDAKSMLLAVLGYLKFPQPLPTFSGPVEVIDGLPVLDGYQCSDCHSCYPKCLVLQKHFKEKHPNIPIPSTFQPVAIQRFKEGQDNGYFVVIPKPTPQSTLNDLIDSIARCYPLEKEPEEKKEKDARTLSPWLRHTRWHELLIGHEVNKLHSHVAQPRVLEFPSLQPAVHELFARASALIDQTSPLVLQKLNSPQPWKDITNTPFHHLQNHDEKIKTYTLPVTGLVAMLLRGPLFPLPGSVTSKIEFLHASLSKGTIDEVVEDLHALLSIIWQTAWLPTEEHRITDPTILYLALSTLQPGGQFQEPKLVSGVISRFEYSMRLSFLRLIHTHLDHQLGFELYQRWITEKVESTFNSLRTLQHLASSIAFGTMSLPRVYWTDRKGYRSMLYKGDPVSLDKIEDMLKSLERRTKDIWEREVLLSLDLSVTYNTITENLSNTEPGYSFVTDPRNACFSNPNLFLHTILGNPQFRSKFISLERNGAIVWNTHELRKWLTSYAKFQLDQITRTNLTAGAPSRITELTAMQTCNTPDYPLRNLVVMDTHIVLLVTYLKTSATTGQDRLIPHSLDGFTSDLVIQDLAIARPFARLAARICHSNQPDVVNLYDTHLFINHTKLFTTTDVTESLKAISAPHFNRPFGVNDWRHISTAFRRMHCGRILDLIEGEDDETIEALQSGHLRRTENRVYGLSAENLAGSSEEMLPLYLDASTDWQRECKVVPGGLLLPYRSALMGAFDLLAKNGRIAGPQTKVQIVTKQYMDERLDDLKKALFEQFELLHARLDVNPGNMSLERTSSCRSIISSGTSIETSSESSTLVERDVSPHEFEYYSKTSSSPRSSGHPSTSPSPGMDRAELESICLSLLRRVLKKPEANWSCVEQLMGIIALVELKQDVLAVLPTGSGKTMLVIIPALLEKNKITVVILPLRALMVDYINKLTSMGVPFEEFDPLKPLSGTYNIILVSADAAKTDTWRQAIAEINQRTPVVRQIFDESHIPPTSSNFRPALLHMSDIRASFSCQVVLLSATVPQELERYLLEDFGLGNNTLILRTKTNRPELQYIWLKPHFEPHMVDPINTLIKQHLRMPQDRALVFVPFTSLGIALSNVMHRPFYHGGEELDDDQRLLLHSDWLSGRSPVMICTSAFGTGNDHAHVRLVVHAGTPFSMLDYTQEVSRAGRDKRPGVCVLYPVKFIKPKNEGNDLSGKLYMYEALTGPPKCIRYLITSYNDGAGTSCADLDTNEICSFCNSTKEDVKRTFRSAFDNATEASKKRRRDRNSTAQDYVANFKEQLSKFVNTCTFCLLCGVDSHHHDIFCCPTLINSVGFDAFKAWKILIRYPYPGVCWKCHVPNGPADTLHPEFKSGIRCEYPDLIAPLVYALLLDPRLRQECSAYFNARLDSPQTALAWVNLRPIQGHMSNLSALFLWYASTH